MHLEVGETFRVIRDGSEIRLVRQFPELETLSAGTSTEEWAAADAFRDFNPSTGPRP
jgi:hypothetical protein